MNILFLTIVSIPDIDEQSLYGDLLKTLKSHGHNVFVVTVREKRDGSATELKDSHGVQILSVATGNITKSGTIEKGLATLRLPYQFERAIDAFFSDISFDLVIYPTPPTTLYGLVKKIKRLHNASTYLLLKDIFPQTSVDLGVLSKTGIKGLIYKYFKHTEKQTYLVSDYIGCMTKGCVQYLLEHERYLSKDRIEVNPNSLIPQPMRSVDPDAFLCKYGIPRKEKLFVYGGNLGVAQCIDFLISCLMLNEEAPTGHFVIAGSGTDREKLERMFRENRMKHATLLPQLMRQEFDDLLNVCDVGVVLLDPRFTIPNCPSRCLSYMQASLPMLFATDAACDFANTAVENGFGMKCSSDNPEAFMEKCRQIKLRDLKDMGAKARAYFQQNCSTEISYGKMVSHFDE